MINTIQAYNTLVQEVSELKLWLNQKEVVEYANYKAANPADKSAQDKIIASLKMRDDKWLNKETEYAEKEAKLSGLRMILDIYKNMLVSDKITKEDLEAYQQAFN